MRIVFFALTAVACVLAARPAASQEAAGGGRDKPPVQWQLEPVVPRGRSHAPITVDLTLRYDGKSLLEGWLEIDFTLERPDTPADHRRLVFRHASEHALGIGEKTVRLMLPPVSSADPLESLMGRARFTTQANGRATSWELSEIELQIHPEWKRSFVLAVVHSDLAEPGTFEQLRTLQIDRFVPTEDPQTDTGTLRLATVIQRLSATDLPVRGIGYFSYDALLLAGGGFHELRERQLDAVREWIEAGGSVCIVPERLASAAHADFLNRLVGAEGAAGPRFVLDEKGLLVDTGGKEGAVGPERHHPGLGRALLVAGFPPVDEFESWNLSAEDVAFLWKIRQREQNAIRHLGTWQPHKVPAQGDHARYFNPEWTEIVNRGPYAPRVSVFEEDFNRFLTPDRLQGLSLPVVAGILSLFLFVIGPADYFLLGWLRSRRLTWILFPLASAGFTLFTVNLAQSRLGATDFRRSLVFVDVVEGGRVARVSRFEQLFTATQKTVETPLSGALYVPVPRISADESYRRASSGAPGRPVPTSPYDPNARPAPDDGPLRWVGLIPASYHVERPMRQWAPRISRQTSIDGAEFSLPLDFDALDAAAWETSEARRPLWDRIAKASSAEGPPLEAVLYRGTHLVRFSGGQETTLDLAQGRAIQDSLMQIINEACTPAEQGLFRPLSQMSPTGAATLEDLALLDSSDLSQVLLAVIARRGDDVIVFRRLYRTD